MTTYYKCVCGFATKNAEFAKFHAEVKQECFVIGKESAFEDKSGIIYYTSNGKHAEFGKWYDSEEKLYEKYEGSQIKARIFKNCDLSYANMMHEARTIGILWSNPIVRADSSERLLKLAEDL